MSDQRLTDLEVKLAFQEHTIAQLDEELRKTNDRLERLQHRVEELIAENEKNQQPLDNPPPPHW